MNQKFSLVVIALAFVFFSSCADNKKKETATAEKDTKQEAKE